MRQSSLWKAGRRHSDKFFWTLAILVLGAIFFIALIIMTLSN
jgi:hypothetical protein